ncbi:response regulator transcription factor [Hydrogenimonas urashimensis]|uniref:response regulator transcription factor n=1 Tax=Hydrogenimonas urashimensis TaxID=2740515 RepID=UPI001915EEFD|nr:response regulator transcription factor [Hydrogenimonas urashimensis]
MKVLLLEDDTMLGELIADHLGGMGHEVEHYVDGEEAEEAILQGRYDLLLLDVNVPGIDGFELLASMRERKDMTSAVMITSRNTSADLKEGFDLGCDDYIKKPFEFAELDARIEHIVRIYGLRKSEPIALGGDTFFEPAAHRLVVAGEAVPLTPKASEILHYLYKNAGRIVSREELVGSLWAYDESPSDATLRSYIKTLRKYVSNIVTERGVGYGFEPG